MADCMPAMIEIGGDLQGRLLDEFVNVIIASGAGFDWGERTCPDSTRDRISEATSDGTTLTLVDDQARWGRFEQLEIWLVEHGLPWRRHSSAKYEFDAEITWFEPGALEPTTVPANEDGEVMVRLLEVQGLLDEPDVSESLRLLVERHDVPDVPPLRVVVPTSPTP